MSLLHLAAAAAVALAAPAAADPVQTPEPPTAVTIVVQLCISVDLAGVETVLDGLEDADLVGQLAPLAPVTVPDTDGLVLAPDVDLPELRAVLNCTIVTVPPITATTPAPTTEPAPTTDPSPTATPPPTTTTLAPSPTTTPAGDDDDFTQIRFVPIGGVATGDGSTEAGA